MGFIMVKRPRYLPHEAHHRSHAEGHGVDKLGPHGAHELGEACRRHERDHRIEDRPLAEGLRVRVGELVAEGGRRKMGEVLDLDLGPFLVGGNAKLELAARTEGQDLLGSHLDRLVQPCLAYFGGHGRILDEGEHAAAAVCFLTVVRHFHEVDIRDGLNELPRRLVNAGGAS